MKNLQLSNNLRTLRNYKNYTQQYVAKKLNVSQPDYSDIENGKTKLSEDKQKIIESLYDLPASILNELNAISLLQYLLSATQELEPKATFELDTGFIFTKNNMQMESQIEQIERGLKFLKTQYNSLQHKIG